MQRWMQAVWVAVDLAVFYLVVQLLARLWPVP